MSSSNTTRNTTRYYAPVLIALCVLLAACSAVIAFDPFGHRMTSAVFMWPCMSVLWLCIAFILLRTQPVLKPSTIVVMTFLAISAHAFVLAPSGVLSGDVNRYQWDGRVINSGIDPYAYAPNAPELAHLHANASLSEYKSSIGDSLARDRSLSRLTFNHLRTIYPPGAEYFFALSTAVSPYGIGWKIPSLVAMAASCWALVILLRGMGRRPEGALAFALSPVVLLQGTMDVHIDVVMVAFALWSLVAWRKGWWLAGGSLLGIAVGVKILPLLLLPWMLRAASTKNRVLFVTAMLATLLAIYAPFLNIHVVESLADFSVRFAANSLLGTMLVQIAPVPIARIALLVMFVTSLALLWYRRVEPMRAMTMAFLFLLFFSPIVHPWYLIILVALGVMMPMRSVLTFATTIAVSGASILAYNKSGVWFEHPALLVLEYGAVVAAFVIDARFDEQSYADRFES